MIYPILAMAEDVLPSTGIPENIRAFVYLVGMVGFPVVVTMFVLTGLAEKLRGVDKSLGELSDRISERPMGLEKTTDFIIYLCESLQNDLVAGLHYLVAKDMSFTSKSADKESLARTLTVIKRELAGFLRPVFRKHERFASRFPSVGGNLSSMFKMTAPSSDIKAGETEARLVGQTYKHPAEATLAVLMNNIPDFGSPLLGEVKARDEAIELPPQLAAMFGQDADRLESKDLGDEDPLPEGPFDVIEPAEFLSLGIDGIETACTILRDSMIEQVRFNASEIEATPDKPRHSKREKMGTVQRWFGRS